MSPESRKRFEFLSRFWKFRPPERAANTGLECNLDDVATNIDRSIETARVQQGFRIPQSSARQLSQIGYRNHMLRNLDESRDRTAWYLALCSRDAQFQFPALTVKSSCATPTPRNPCRPNGCKRPGSMLANAAEATSVDSSGLHMPSIRIG